MHRGTCVGDEMIVIENTVCCCCMGKGWPLEEARALGSRRVR